MRITTSAVRQCRVCRRRLRDHRLRHAYHDPRRCGRRGPCPAPGALWREPRRRWLP